MRGCYRDSLGAVLSFGCSRWRSSGGHIRMRTILSIDPSGDPRGHTGISLIGYDEINHAHALAGWAVQGGVDGFRDWYAYLPSELDPASSRWVEPKFDTVIVEQFIDRQIRGADRSALLVEGVVRYLWPNVVLSPASGKNTAVPDATLKRLGLYDDKSHHHDVREANRHAVRWLKNQGHKPTLLAGW